MNCLWNFDFNPRSPHRERHVDKPITEHSLLFQSTLPSQGATNTRGRSGRNSHFNPRSPHRERPTPGSRLTQAWTFQSTLPSQGATVVQCQFLLQSDISIHAPLTGSDLRGIWSNTGDSYFNPRSPHRERPLHPFCHSAFY